MDHSKSPFQFKQPRQRRIHQRLLLIGSGPAAFFVDACRMMEQPDLDTATHLVSHCLGKIESSVRAVLAPLAPTEAKLMSAEKGTHEKSIRAVLRALSIEETDPVAQTWLALSGEANPVALHSRAHRKALGDARRLDESFRIFWDDFNSLLDIVLARFESRYLDTNRILDDLLAKKTPGEKDMKALLNNVPNNVVAYTGAYDPARRELLVFEEDQGNTHFRFDKHGFSDAVRGVDARWPIPAAKGA